MFTRRTAAFTLVELLVVIGIIALLISILLPALNRARAHANLVDCQARLRQMGQAMQIYAANNKGLVPWSMLYHDAGTVNAAAPNPYPNERWWKWHYTLSQVLGTDQMTDSNSLWTANNPIFVDKDTVEGAPWGWRCDYITNPRVFVPNDAADNFPPGRSMENLTQRKLASIANASEVMAIWDAPQWSGYGNSANEYAHSMGGWGWYHSGWNWFCLGGTGVNYGAPIPPGPEWQGSARELQKKWNKDFAGAPYAPAVAGEDFASVFRFRHMQNTALNGLFVDGHVESRKVGEVLGRDVCTSPPTR